MHGRMLCMIDVLLLLETVIVDFVATPKVVHKP